MISVMDKELKQRITDFIEEGERWGKYFRSEYPDILANELNDNLGRIVERQNELMQILLEVVNERR